MFYHQISNVIYLIFSQIGETTIWLHFLLFVMAGFNNLCFPHSIRCVGLRSKRTNLWLQNPEFGGHKFVNIVKFWKLKLNEEDSAFDIFSRNCPTFKNCNCDGHTLKARKSLK